MNDKPADFTASMQNAFLRISDSDREKLSEALQALLAHGSILGLETGQSALYHWCRQNMEMLREITALTGLEIFLHHEERIVQALPHAQPLRLDLRQDATLVWLALWYVADMRWRDEGQSQALLTVEELNGVLKDTLLPDMSGLPAQGRLREILRQAARYNLIDFLPAEPFEESGIEILPAIRRIVPFRDLAEWTETASAFKREGSEITSTLTTSRKNSEPNTENL